MNVKQILEKWLRENGYTGLCNEHCGCADIDLMPCGEAYVDCEPGFWQQAGPDNEDFDEGEWFCGPNKPEAAQ